MALNVIDWQHWTAQADSTANAKQIRSDGDRVIRKRIFGSHDVQVLDQKRAGNQKEFNANLRSLDAIQRSLTKEFGKAVGQAVFNQVFASKVWNARPISASDIRLADSLGKNLGRGLDWLSSIEGRENAEKALNHFFKDAIVENTSELDAAGIEALGEQVKARLNQAGLNAEARIAAQEQIKGDLQGDELLKPYLNAALLLQGPDRQKFLQDVRTRFGIKNPIPLQGLAGLNQEFHKKIEAVIDGYEKIAPFLDKEVDLSARKNALNNRIQHLKSDLAEAQAGLVSAQARVQELHASKDEDLALLAQKQKEVESIQGQLALFDSTDKQLAEEFQAQLQPLYLRSTELASEISAVKLQAGGLQKERAQITDLRNEELKKFDAKVNELEDKLAKGELSPKSYQKEKSKLDQAYHKSILTIDKKLQAFERQPVKGQPYTKGEHLIVLEKQILELEDQESKNQARILELTSQRLAANTGEAEGQTKLGAWEAELRQAQQQHKELGQKVEDRAVVVQIAEQFEGTVAGQVANIETEIGHQEHSLGKIENELVQVESAKQTVAKDLQLNLTNAANPAGGSEYVTQLLSDHAKITQIFSGRIEAASLAQSELESLLSKTDEVLLDHPAVFANSHSAFWRVARTHIEDALLPKLQDEQAKLVALGANATPEQQVRLGRINGLLSRTPELPIPAGLSSADLQKHRQAESTARIELAKALSAIRAGASPAEVALEVPFDSEVRQTIHQLLSLRQVSGFYPNTTNFDAEHALEDALEETSLVPLIQNEIRHTGQVEIAKFEDLLKQRLAESKEITLLRQQANDASFNLEQAYASGKKHTGILAQTRAGVDEALVSIKQISDELQSRQEQLQNSVRLLQRRIDLAKKIETLSDSSDERIKLYKPFIDQALRDRSTDALGQKPADLPVDPVLEVTKNTVLDKAFKDKALAVLSGATLDSLNTDKTGARNRNIAVTLSRLGLKTNPTLPDGNCFFHAISVQLAAPLTIGELRKQIADEAQAIRDAAIQNPQSLPVDVLYELNPEQIDNIRLDASKLTNPADQIEAWGEAEFGIYVARITGRPVVVITANDGTIIYEKDKPARAIDFASKSDLPADAIILAHNGEDHWESVTSDQAEDLPAYAPGTIDEKPAGPSPAEIKAQKEEARKQAETQAEKLRLNQLSTARQLAPKTLPPLTDKSKVGLTTAFASGLADPSQLSVEELISFVKSFGDLEGELRSTLNLKKPTEYAAYTLAKDQLISRVRSRIRRLDREITDKQTQLNNLGGTKALTRATDKFFANILGDQDAKDVDSQKTTLTQEKGAQELERANLEELLSKDLGISPQDQLREYIAFAGSQIRNSGQDPLPLAKEIAAKGLAKPIIDEIHARQGAVFRNEATAALVDPATLALLEACEVVYFTEGYGATIVKNGGVDPDLQAPLRLAESALQRYTDEYNAIYENLKKDRAVIAEYEAAGAAKKKVLLSKANYDNAKANEAAQLADLDRLSPKLSEARILVADATRNIQLVELIKTRYRDIYKSIEAARRIGKTGTKLGVLTPKTASTVTP